MTILAAFAITFALAACTGEEVDNGGVTPVPMAPNKYANIRVIQFPS